MSLVSEEFPDEVCMSGPSDGRGGNLSSSQKHYCQRDHDKGQGGFHLVHLTHWPSFCLLTPSRFPCELRRSPYQLMSRQRGCPRTLWTIQVDFKKNKKKNPFLTFNLKLVLTWTFAPSRSWAVGRTTFPRNIKGGLNFSCLNFLYLSSVNTSVLFSQANVICIVYSVNNKKSIEKVSILFFLRPFRKYIAPLM